MERRTKIVFLWMLVACALVVLLVCSYAARWVDGALGLVCYVASVGWLKEVR